MTYRNNYRRSNGPSPFAKVEVGDLASITVKSGETVTGEVVSVDDRGIGLEIERQGGTYSAPKLETVVVVIPWTNQKRRSLVGGASADRARGSGRVIVTTFSSGAQSFRNSRGRCEDAPCCGCCS